MPQDGCMKSFLRRRISPGSVGMERSLSANQMSRKFGDTLQSRKNIIGRLHFEMSLFNFYWQTELNTTRGLFDGLPLASRASFVCGLFPGAYAPGFMLSSAPRIKTTET